MQNFCLTILTFRVTSTPLTFCVSRDLKFSQSQFQAADENVQSMFYFVSDSNSGGEFEINGVNEKIPASYNQSANVKKMVSKALFLVFSINLILRSYSEFEAAAPLILVVELMEDVIMKKRSSYFDVFYFRFSVCIYDVCGLLDFLNFA